MPRMSAGRRGATAVRPRSRPAVRTRSCDSRSSSDRALDECVEVRLQLGQRIDHLGDHARLHLGDHVGRGAGREQRLHFTGGQPLGVGRRPPERDHEGFLRQLLTPAGGAREVVADPHDERGRSRADRRRPARPAAAGDAVLDRVQRCVDHPRCEALDDRVRSVQEQRLLVNGLLELRAEAALRAKRRGEVRRLDEGAVRSREIDVEAPLTLTAAPWRSRVSTANRLMSAASRRLRAGTAELLGHLVDLDRPLGEPASRLLFRFRGPLPLLVQLVLLGLDEVLEEDELLLGACCPSAA